jgi:hypothetical protein
MVVIDLDQRAAASPSLGTPVGCFLTGGEPHDLVGADHLLPTMQADTLILDRQGIQRRRASAGQGWQDGGDPASHEPILAVRL